MCTQSAVDDTADPSVPTRDASRAWAKTKTEAYGFREVTVFVLDASQTETAMFMMMLMMMIG